MKNVCSEVQTHQPEAYIFGLIYSQPFCVLLLDGPKTLLHTASCIAYVSTDWQIKWQLLFLITISGARSRLCSRKVQF